MRSSLLVAAALVTGCNPFAIIGFEPTEDMLNLSDEQRAQLAQLKVDAAEVQMMQIKGVLQLHSLKSRGNYPSTDDGLDMITDYLAGQKFPVDPWGNDYIYLSPSPNPANKFELICLGADGEEGGTGIAADLNIWELK
jgi:general secretion pathway protein G